MLRTFYSFLFTILLFILFCNNSNSQVVSNLNDSGPGSLRQAINDANSGAVITFSAEGTITLESELTIDKDLSIQGPGADLLTISGNNASRIFNIDSSDVNIAGLTIADGNSSVGGGIFNAGNLTVTNCTFSSNSADFDGGGISNNNAVLKLTGCTFINNTAGHYGSGIYSAGNAETSGLLVNECTFSKNTAEAGGGIYSNSDVTILRSSFLNNNTEYGGAIELFQENQNLASNINCNIINSTLSSNNANIGGGAIDTDSARLNIKNCTITNNTSPSGRNGIWSWGTITIKNTILANGKNRINNIQTDNRGTVTSFGYNLEESNSGLLSNASDIVNTNPMLGPLQANGIHPLLPGSPAIDAGYCSNYILTDQLGTPRPQGSACDIGAFEFVQNSEQFSENFDSYTAGQMLSCQNSNDWITWTHTPCEDADALVSDAYSFSAPNSMLISQGDDIVKEHGNITSGKWKMSFQFYIPSGKVGIFDMISKLYYPSWDSSYEAFSCSFNPEGKGKFVTKDSTYFSFEYDSWQLIEVIIDLDKNLAEFSMEGSLIKSWAWTNGTHPGTGPLQIAANAFFGFVPQNEMYIDDYKFGEYKVTGIEDENTIEVPNSFSLEQNYPNPFNPATNIKFRISKPGNVKLAVYNLLGEEVKVLVNGHKETGSFEVKFDGGNLSSGVYIYRLETPGFIEAKKMILMK